MADAWRKYKHAIAEKRTGKRKVPSYDILKKEEIVIQRLSAEVSRKVQKYSRIGPREFVAYEYDEVTISNIKEACTKHFSTTDGSNMTCDILVGEQGSSCTFLDHFPDLRVSTYVSLKRMALASSRFNDQPRGSVSITLRKLASHYHVINHQVQVKCDHKVCQSLKCLNWERWSMKSVPLKLLIFSVLILTKWYGLGSKQQWNS